MLNKNIHLSAQLRCLWALINDIVLVWQAEQLLQKRLATLSLIKLDAGFIALGSQ